MSCRGLNEGICAAKGIARVACPPVVRSAESRSAPSGQDPGAGRRHRAGPVSICPLVRRDQGRPRAGASRRELELRIGHANREPGERIVVINKHLSPRGLVPQRQFPAPLPATRRAFPAIGGYRCGWVSDAGRCVSEDPRPFPHQSPARPRRLRSPWQIPRKNDGVCERRGAEEYLCKAPMSVRPRAGEPYARSGGELETGAAVRPRHFLLS
jgi:hypothetical protein